MAVDDIQPGANITGGGTGSVTVAFDPLQSVVFAGASVARANPPIATANNTQLATTAWVRTTTTELITTALVGIGGGANGGTW